MSKIGTGIITLVLLTSSVLVALTVTSAMSEGTTVVTEEDLARITDEVVDEISTYIQIRDQKGKFYGAAGDQKIEKIALLISPLVTQDIDVSQLTIQLSDGEIVRILTYSAAVEPIGSNSLFEHPVWSNITGENFGFISIIDSDGSLANYNIINDYSDNAYIIFRLPPDMALSKGDKILVTLFPSTGITRIIELEAPLPMRSVITFE